MSDTLVRLRRTRIVNFRVTEEEYERLRNASRAIGNGISGYARQATLQLADVGLLEEAPRQAAPAGDLATYVADLSDRVARLEAKVRELVDPVESMREVCD